MRLFFHVGECHAYLAIQGSHIVDGDFFTVVIANGRSMHDVSFTVIVDLEQHFVSAPSVHVITF
jgi:hypothetical protein